MVVCGHLVFELTTVLKMCWHMMQWLQEDRDEEVLYLAPPQETKEFKGCGVMFFVVFASFSIIIFMQWNKLVF